MYGNFDEYDQRKMTEAKQILRKVLEYNYGAPRMSRKTKRLETIIKKLEELQNLK